MRRVLRFIKAMFRYMLHGRRVEFDTYVKRLDACNRCEHLNRENWTCSLCGCYLDKKAQMSTEKCREEKW